MSNMEVIDDAYRASEIRSNEIRKKQEVFLDALEGLFRVAASPSVLYEGWFEVNDVPVLKEIGCILVSYGRYCKHEEVKYIYRPQ